MDVDNTLIQLGDHNGVGLNEITKGIPVRKGETLGSYYYNEQWSKGTLHLFKGKKVYPNLLLRFNESTHTIEIKQENKITTINSYNILSFTIDAQANDKPVQFLNSSFFGSGEVVPLGFMEVLVEDSVKLLKYSKVIVKEATYNEKLGTGTLNDKLIRKSTYYIYMDHKLALLPKTLKKAKVLLGQEYDSTKENVQKNGWDWRKEEDLVRIVNHLNKSRK